MSFGRLHALGNKLGLDHEALRDAAWQRWPGITSLKDLTPAQLRQFEGTLLHRARQSEIGNPQSESPRLTRRVAPRGKRRPEGVIPLATAAQRGRIAKWIELLEQQQNWTANTVLGVIRRSLGQEFVERILPASRLADSIAAAVQTGPEAQLLIRGLYGELKRLRVFSPSEVHHGDTETQRIN
jgi:hypothetical protein